MNFSRRDFSKLAMSGVVASALRSFQAEAQTQTIPKRIVLFFTPHGTVWDRWRPSTGSTVTNFNLPYILAPLAPLKNKITLIDGVGLPTNGPGAPHTRGPAVLFTGSPLADDGTFTRGDCSGGCSFGWNTYQSVDSMIANRITDQVAYKNLPFSVRSGSGFPGSHISYAAPAVPNVARDNPITAWTQLFGSLSTPEAERHRKLTRRLNVLNTVKGDLDSLNGKISRADQTRLDAHAQALSELQTALTTQRESCSVPTQAMGMTTNDPNWKPWATDRQIELLASSLACGLTRVASLQYRVGENDGGSEGIYTWLGQDLEHHLTTHDGSDEAQGRLAEISKWYTQKFLYLLQKLDSFPEADGTLLDHTLVIWGSEIGEGRTHDISNIPFVVAGGGKRGITGGRYLTYPRGTLNQRLLVSAARYFGFNDVNTFGTVDMGSGPLPGLL